MKKRIILLMILILLPLHSVHGEGDPNEQEALQHFLSIHEIEKELARIDQEEKMILNEIEALEQKIVQQEERIEQYRQHVNDVARAYYTGDRADLLLLLFTAKDITEFLNLYDYLTYILKHDQISLENFHNELVTLQELVAKKEDQLSEIEALRAHLLAQKKLLAEVELKLAQAMAGVSDTERVEAMQAQLIHDWENRGIPTFELLLQAISSSMSAVPKAFKDNITLSLTGMKLTISDQRFTDFLKSQSPVFAGINITFDTDGLHFFGEYDGMAVTMKGSYQLESEEKVSFQIDELRFNNFLLPQSTAEDLQEKYDLGIYPAQIFPGLRVKEIHLSEHNLELLFMIQF